MCVVDAFTFAAAAADPFCKAIGLDKPMLREPLTTYYKGLLGCVRARGLVNVLLSAVPTRLK